MGNIIKISQIEDYKIDDTPLIQKWLKTGSNEESFRREAAFAVQAINKNPMLKNAQFGSIVMAVYNVALTGLTLNPTMGYAYLVPRRNKDVIEACLEPGYKGLIALAIQEGLCSSIEAHEVCENDDFVYDHAKVEKVVKHIIPLTGDRGKMIAVYSIATLRDGLRHGEIMTKNEVEDIMERSESYKAYKAKKIKSTTWVSDAKQMWRKTVIKRHINYLPKNSPESRVAKAVDVDNEYHGFREFASPDQIAYIHTKIEGLKLDDRQYNYVISRLNQIEFRDQADELITYLEQFEVDAISAGNNYNQGDIKKKLEKTV